MPDHIRADLQSALSITPEDTAANREGRLSARQIQHLQEQAQVLQTVQRKTEAAALLTDASGGRVDILRGVINRVTINDAVAVVHLNSARYTISVVAAPHINTGRAYDLYIAPVSGQLINAEELTA